MLRRLEIEGYSDYLHAYDVRETCKAEEGSRLFVAVLMHRQRLGHISVCVTL